MPVVKGGVWTNAEDEILKVAVAKYGLNQWARISSLQHRKTAKQCKARWNQWLDPAIKKTEWSKEEDEKLLHLAKILPQQWLTIAPIVGRTAQQCIERYDKLLSDAQAREGEELGLMGPDGGDGQAPTADDVRRLRPGEVDPDPETKPARPDTVDMDEDEKEMLSEARARLANTQGKKAKRKARERQLEESRRLAQLQKRRELKNAGINIKITSRKKGEMDYNADIPFEKKAAPGFYDTLEEIELNEKEREAFDPRKQQMATKRKADQHDEDAENKRRKAEKNPNAAFAAAAKAGQMQKIREAERSAKRRSLVLPTPQVSEGELEDIVKMGMAGERASRLAGQGDNEATRDLVGKYTDVVGSTPIRTPRAPPQEDHIANEIRNIEALKNAQSSLLGGENTPLHEGSATTGFEGAAPKSNAITTPNPMATPFQRANGAMSATPRGQAPGATPMRTPRDSFAINSQASKAISLQGRLAALPKPVATEWELEVPDEQLDTFADGSLKPVDAAERDRRAAAIAEAARQAELRRRSQVLQRQLPRLLAFDSKAFAKGHRLSSEAAFQTILAETERLVAHDNSKYPVNKARASKPGKPLENIDDEYLNRARQLLSKEAQKSLPAELEDRLALPEIQRASLVPYGYDDDKDAEHDVKTVSAVLETIQLSVMDKATGCNEKEKKLSMHFGGYQQRAKALSQKVVNAAEKLENARTEKNAFLNLQILEDAALAHRLSALRDEVSFLSRREREAQDAYRIQKLELDDLEMQLSDQ